MNATSSTYRLLGSLLLVTLLMLGVGVQKGLGQASPPRDSPAATSPTPAQRSDNPVATSPTSAPSPTETSAEPQPGTATTEKANAKTSIPPAASQWVYVVAVLLVVLLGFLFFLLLFWASRHEQSSYLGSLFRDSVEEFEYKRFAQPHIEKWLNFGYHAHARQDPEIKKAVKARQDTEAKARQDAEAKLRANEAEGDRAQGSRSSGSGGGLWLPGPSGGTGTGTGSGYEPEEERAAKKNYDWDLARAREKASRRAQSAANVDLNVLRGRGTEFVLEFTAVVTLVFAVTILGLLSILDGQSIATLLAAIAGYVLGRASSGKQGEGQRSGITTAEVTQLIQAVTGATRPQKEPVKKAEEAADKSSANASDSNAAKEQS